MLLTNSPQCLPALPGGRIACVAIYPSAKELVVATLLHAHCKRLDDSFTRYYKSWMGLTHHHAKGRCLLCGSWSCWKWICQARRHCANWEAMALAARWKAWSGWSTAGMSSPSSFCSYHWAILPARSSRWQSSSLGTMPFNVNRISKRIPWALSHAFNVANRGPFMICDGLRMLSFWGALLCRGKLMLLIPWEYPSWQHTRQNFGWVELVGMIYYLICSESRRNPWVQSNSNQRRQLRKVPLSVC